MKYNKKRKARSSVPLLDLHGVTADEVYGLLDRFLLDASNETMVKVMPGKGKGVVKGKVIEYLEGAGYSWTYELKGDGNHNTGVLLVRMA